MKAGQQPLRDRRAGFNMIEMTCALAIFAAVSAAFYASSNALARYMQRLGWQSEAASVLDNTLARVAGRTTPSRDLLTALFNDEFEKNARMAEIGSRPVTSVRGHLIHLEIIDSQSRRLAELAFPLEGAGP